MKSSLVFLVLVALANASTHPAFKDNTEYTYRVNGRTFTSLYQLSDQYSGILLKAKLHLSPRSDGKLQARISDAQYAQIHTQLPNGWSSYVPESELSYKQLELSEKPFQIVEKNGVIKSLIVEKELSNWETNVIKSIVSQFQLDIKGKNVIPSPINTLPKEDRFDGVYKTMEETITGETETSYDIHRLPEYLIQSQPWLVPQPKLKGDSHVIEVIKNKNYTNSDESPAYHYGLGDLSEDKPSFNRMGKFFNRQSNSRVILTGIMSKFTIQNSQTVNKIIINPTLNAKEQGLVVSMLNLTLFEVKTQNEQHQDLNNPVEIGNLVYTYESPFAQSNQVHQKQQQEQEDSEEQSTERSWQKYRRLNSQLMKTMRKLQQDDSSSSSSSIEQMNQYQPRPVMSDAPELPLLPYYMGYYGRSIKANRDFDLKQNIKRIAKEISEDLQQPEKILTHSTLSKYVMLCSLVRLMNEKEIEDVTQELYTQSRNGQERLTWVSFRDAVAEAGTGPAFLNIEKWIESKKIEKEEAAEVVAAMSYAVRVPTEDYMRKFFEAIQKHDWIRQEKLNETAVMVYTNLVNKVYVNKNKSHNGYPVYSFGNFYTAERKQFVKSKVIPYLSQQLREAVSEADTRKIHVYIRALGNVGHKQIFKTFEPYLEGEKQVSQFQRMLMVLCLDKVVVNYPDVSRSVLYRIYQNIAEIPEVRVVAVYQLMRTNPPAEMIQRMAENTHTDPQEQVNSAIKHVIECACELKSSASQDLRWAAESARPFLTKKSYGQHYSYNLLQEFIGKNMDVEFDHNLLQVGSTDSSFPKGIKYGLRRQFSDMKQNLFNIQAMTSSIKELTNVFYQQTEKYENDKNQNFQENGDSKWSSAKIAESLNLKTNEREQLEGFIYTQMEHFEKLWSFDNKTIEQLPEVIQELEQMYKNGKEFSYTKLRQLKDMALSLPTEMGFPCLYTYDTPMLVQFEGNIKAEANPELTYNNKLRIPEQIFSQLNGFVTISTKVQSHLSVVTPFDHQLYIAGFDKNVQMHLPIHAKINVDIKNQQAKIEFEVKENHKDARLLHYSSWPYTSRSDIMSLSPVALRPTTHLIKPQGNSHRSFDFVFGQKQTGMAFRVWGHHPQQSKDLLQLVQMLQKSEFSTVWQQIWDDASLQQTEASIAYVPEQSNTRKVIFRLGYKQQYQRQPDSQNEEAFWTMDQLSSKVQQESKHRQDAMLKYVGAGIKNAQLRYLNSSLEFQGDKKYEHIFTMAYAKSNVAPESRLVAFYKMMSEQPREYAIQLKGYVPNTNGLDLTYSLKNNPTAKYEVLFQHRGNEQHPSKVKVTIDLARSEKRKQYIERQPLYDVCKKQMEEGNRQLSACQNLTIESNYFDDIKIQLQHENLQRDTKSAIESIFRGIRFFYYPMTEFKKLQSKSQNNVHVRVQFQPERLRQVNLTVRVDDEETKFFNLSLSETAKTVFVPHPVFHLKARFLGQMLGQENIRPTCVLDKNAAQTFSNLTYPLSLGNDWTLMMEYLPQQARLGGQSRQQPREQLRNQQENYAVLVRELSEQQKEFMVVFRHKETKGKTIEINMKPKKQGSMTAPFVMINGEELQFNEKHAADLYNGLVEVYALPNGEVKLEIRDRFYILFDGVRAKFTAMGDTLRDSVVGLCGRFNDDKYEEFWTRNNCIVKSPKKFVQSYIVQNGKQSQEKYEDCIPKMLPLYADVITNHDVENRESYAEETSSGISLRNRYVEQNGDICFTIRPVPVCKNLPRTSISKEVPVHCITKTKTAYYLKKQIDQGGNPDFSHKTTTKTIQMEIPEQCF